MDDSRVAGVAGVLVGLAAVPVLHFVAVDLESKAAAPAYLAAVDEHYVRIAMAGGAGLLLAAGLLIHLIAVRRLAPSARGLLADTTTAIAAMGALGVALGSAAGLMAAYGAHEEFPFEAVRPLGLLAENLAVVLLPAMGASALLVAVLGVRDGILPRWLGVVGGVFAVLLTLLGVLLPGAGGIPAIVWILVAGIGLLISSRAPARAHQSPTTTQAS